MSFLELIIMLRLTKTLLIFILTLGFTSLSWANSPLQLNKPFGLNQANSQPAALDINTQIATLKDLISQSSAEEQHFLKMDKNSASKKRALERQVNAPNIAPKLKTDTSITEQTSTAYQTLSALKQTDKDLNEQLNALIARQRLLPNLLTQIEAAISQQNKTLAPPLETPVGERYELQTRLLLQQKASLTAELDTSPKQAEIIRLRQQLNRLQLNQQEGLIELINHYNIENRQQKTASTLAVNLIEQQQFSDPLSQQIHSYNQELGERLISLNSKISNSIDLQEQTEKRYQRLALQLTNVQEQLTWVKSNATFGERFLEILHSLPKPPNQELLQSDITDSRFERYQLEQQQSANAQQLSAANMLSEEQIAVLRSQQTLIDQLIESYDHYLSELAKLNISYDQYIVLHETLKNTLNEQLFWVPNAAPINTLWLKDLTQSGLWLFQDAQWQQLIDSLHNYDYPWAWWIIIVILCFMAQDLLTPHFNQVMHRYSEYVGNVTQDKFKYTVKALVFTLIYSIFKPLPILLAGIILFDSSNNFTHAIGAGVLSIGVVYLIYQFAFILSQDKGILISHFGRPKDLIQDSHNKLQTLMIFSLPVIGILGFTQAIDNTTFRNSIGRGAFIFFCYILWLMYKFLLGTIQQYRSDKLDNLNMKMFQKIMWTILLSAPIISAVLSVIGYYYTAFQMLIQLQISLLFGFGFLLVYQLIKRWMLIERRLIAFDRAKAKRAERIALREREGANDIESLDNFEEPVVDLETISSQSLDLVRSLLILAFFATTLAWLSQTHTALLPFLDGITLWTTTTNLNGIEQLLPITLKSLCISGIIIGLSVMISRNLPGLLELTLLQRLDLSTGTGFAITTVSSYLVLFIGTLASFGSLGMEWSKLQWLVAALSVGLGFGLQEIFANFISGLIILFEKPIRIGDTVTIRDLSGTVSKIKIRATTIVDWDRKEIIVPNKAFITEQLVNWSLSDPITRVIVTVNVARDSDPNKVEMLLRQVVSECEFALKIPEPDVWFAGFGSHTLNFEVRTYAKDMDARWPLRHSLHKQVVQKLKDNHVELAYPQMDLHINQKPSENKSVFTKP